jgi:hypothetical protein
MKNPLLESLNFKELLCYSSKFFPKHFYDSPIECCSFCVECEKNGAIKMAGGKLTLMSHACDTYDYELLFQQPLEGDHLILDPIIIILENPGKDYSLGKEITYQNVTKKPPVYHYYFSTELGSWPSTYEDLDGNYYGSYFAYLIKRHGLKNAYITNLVKCKTVDSHSPHFVEQSCVNAILTREIEIFQPKLALCFSRKVYNSFRRYFPQIKSLYIYHPSFIRNRSYTKGITPKEAMQKNDLRVGDALSRFLN